MEPDDFIQKIFSDIFRLNAFQGRCAVINRFKQENGITDLSRLIKGGNVCFLFRKRLYFISDAVFHIVFGVGTIQNMIVFRFRQFGIIAMPAGQEKVGPIKFQISIPSVRDEMFHIDGIRGFGFAQIAFVAEIFFKPFKHIAALVIAAFFLFFLCQAFWRRRGFWVVSHDH
nr:hypothetical protein [Desulfonema ishimotonii]